jgi:glycosyltransferase involved in cell wall biosynthesis
VRLIVNASIVGERPTGLGLYSINLVRALDRLREDLVVFTSCPEALGPLRGRMRAVPAAVRPERGGRGHLARLAWLQTAGRIRVRREAGSVLLNTVPEGVLDRSIAQVTVVHDLLPLAFPADYPRQQLYFRHLVPRMLRTARAVVADSESTRQDVARRYALPVERVRVIHPGLDPTMFHPDGERPRGAGRGAPYLLFVGNLMPHKNVLRLLEAFARLAPRRCRLVIRGSGRPAHVRAVRDRIEGLGLGGAVRLVPYATDAGLRALYAGAVALVFPSLVEGFGLPVLEAMACGTPVITSNASSLPEVAGDAALLVDPGDTGALAGAMERVLGDPTLREDLRSRGLRHAKAFTWERTAAEIASLVDQLSGAA